VPNIRSRLFRLRSVVSYSLHGTIRIFRYRGCLNCSLRRFYHLVSLLTAFERLLDQRWNRFQDDPHIQPNAHVSRVKYVHRNHLAERGFILAAHLPVSGKSGRCINSLLLPCAVMLKFMRQTRTRPDQAHLSPEHVENLGQLIQAARPQETTARNQTGVARCIEFCHRTIFLHQTKKIFRMRLRLRIHVHRSEFEEHERTSSIPDTLLPKKNRPSRSNYDPSHHQNDQWQPDRQSHQNACYVEDAFPARHLWK